MADDFKAYGGLALPFEGGHNRIRHKRGIYANGDVRTNAVEGSHALVKRGILGIYHNVSSQCLRRYRWRYDFLWDNRKLNDSERSVAAIKQADNLCLTCKGSPLHA